MNDEHPNAVLPMMRTTAPAPATATATATEEDAAGVRVRRDVAVSAPGKVLLCGGYLLLVQQPQPQPQQEPLPPWQPSSPTIPAGEVSEPIRGPAGIVLAVDKRFYCRGNLRVATAGRSGSGGGANDHGGDAAANDDDDDDDADDDNGDPKQTKKVEAEEHSAFFMIRVESPQYGEAYDYKWHPSRPRQLVVTVVPNDTSSHHHHKNSFVEHTLRICCDNYAPLLADLLRVRVPSSSSSSQSSSVAPDSVMGEIRLVVLGDDEFWSHPRPRPPRSDPEEEDGNADDGSVPIAADPSLHPVAVAPASEPSQSSSPSRKQQPQRRFRTAPRAADGTIMKTGLGSSACLVTSLVAAMDHLLRGPEDDDDDDDDSGGDDQRRRRRRRRRLRRIANLSQLCHCVAQGKIGSGFDVSAACWGSHAYRRFDASGLHLDALLGGNGENNDNDNDEAETKDVASIVQRAVRDESWTERCVVMPIVPSHGRHRRPFALEVVLADTAGGGSSSPGMSRLVLEHEGSDAWNALAVVNRTLLELWRRVMTLDLSDVERQYLASRTAKEWIELGHGRPSCAHDVEEEVEEEETGVSEAVRRAAQVLGELSLAFRGWRGAFKRLGVLAGADLEPDAQSSLADSTERLRGVVAAVVPGAGGHDALACLYVNDEPTRTRIVDHWRSSRDGAVPALDVRIVPFGDGVRVEDLDSFLWSCEGAA